MITYKLNYGSEEQSATEQDIETKEFNDLESFYNYLQKRTRPDYFNGIYVCWFHWDVEQSEINYSPSTFITRSWNHLLKYAKNPQFVNTSFEFYVYEYSTYVEVIEYLKDHFEPSSFMYESHQ